MKKKRRRKMVVNNSWTGYETWAQVFLFSKSAHCYDTEPTQSVHIGVIVQ